MRAQDHMKLSLSNFNGNNFRLNKLTLALAGSLVLLTAPLTWADSVIEGRVTDASNKVYFSRCASADKRAGLNGN